jgi:hypothetical protein
MNRPRYSGRGTLPFINDVSDTDVVIDKAFFNPPP